MQYNLRILYESVRDMDFLRCIFVYTYVLFLSQKTRMVPWGLVSVCMYRAV